MGRKSIAPLRKKEILEAYERCIDKYGFMQSSTRKIAEEAGINQPMIAHYFGNRSGLVKALVERVLEKVQKGLEYARSQSTDENRTSKVLDFVFGPGLWGNNPEGDSLGHLLAASRQDKELHSHINSMYEIFLQMCESEIVYSFPNTSKTEVKKVAYGIMCLIIGNDVALSVNLSEENRLLARNCAEHLISTLEQTH